MTETSFDEESFGVLTRILRFPVKSMRGEDVDVSDLTINGLAYDRLFAFETESAPPGMLRVSGTERQQLLRFQAKHTSTGVQVLTPAGEKYAVRSPELIVSMSGFSGLKLTYKSTPQTDCRPLSLISFQTINFLAEELGEELDPLQFRANLYVNVQELFAEDLLVGQTFQIGSSACIRILERDPRCRFITYNPVTTEPIPRLMSLLHRHHQGRAGVYARVVCPGQIHIGDEIRHYLATDS